MKTTPNTTEMVTYTIADGITVTASPAFIQQLREEQAERARRIAAKNAAKGRG